MPLCVYSFCPLGAPLARQKTPLDGTSLRCPRRSGSRASATPIRLEVPPNNWVSSFEIAPAYFSIALELAPV